MVASKQVETQFYRVFGRQHGKRFGALARVIGRPVIPILSKGVVPAAKREGVELLECAAPEFAETFSSRKNFKTASNIVRKQILEHFSSGSRKTKEAISVTELV